MCLTLLGLTKSVNVMAQQTNTGLGTRARLGAQIIPDIVQHGVGELGL